MMARMFRIGPEGQEDAGKSEETLVKLGIAVRNNNGEFRSFDNILKDVNKAWSGWGNVTQNNVAQVVGGTHHYSKFINLQENFGIAVSATETALNSQGSAMRENAKAMDSISGRMGVLKASMESVFTNLVSSDFIKTFVSGVTGLVNGIGYLSNIFGVLPMIITATVVAIKIFNAELFATSIASMKLVATNLLGYIQKIPVAFEMAAIRGWGFRGVLSLLGITQALVTVGTLAMTAALTLGLSVAITAVVSGVTNLISSWVHAREEQQKFITDTQESVKSLKEQTKSLKDLKSQYDSLLTKQDGVGLNSDEKTKLKSIQDQLITQFPALKQGLNNEAEGYRISSKALDENIKKLDEKLIRDQKVLDLKSGEELSKLGNDITDSKNNETKAGGFYDKTMLNTLNSAIAQKEELSKLLDNHKEDVDYQNLKKEFEDQITTLKIQRDSFQGSIDKAIGDASDKTSDLISKKKDQINIIFGTMIDDMKKNGATLSMNAQGVISSLVNSFSKSDQAFTTNKAKLQEIFTNIIPSVNALDNTSKDFAEKVQVIISNALIVAKVNPDDSKIFADKIKQSIVEGLTNGNDIADALGGSLGNVSDIEKELVKNTQALSTAYDEMNESGHISVKTAAELIDKYPDLIDQIKVEGDMITINGQALKSKFDLEKNIYINTIKMQNEKLENARKATLDQLGLDAKELKSKKDLMDMYVTLANAEEANASSTAFATAMSKVDITTPIDDKADPTGEIRDKRTQEFDRIAKEEYAKLSANAFDKSNVLRQNVIDAQDIIDRNKKIISLVDTFTVGNSNDKVKKDKSTGSETNDEKYAKKEIYLDQLKLKLTQAEIDLTDNETAKKSASGEKLISLMENEITLLGIKRKAINDIAAEEESIAIRARDNLASKNIGTNPDGSVNLEQYNSVVDKLTAQHDKKGLDSLTKSQIKNNIDNIDKWVDEYSSNLQSSKKSKNDKSEVNTTIANVRNDIDKVKVDDIFKSQESGVKEYTNSLANLKAEFEGIDENDFKSKLSNVNQQIKLQSDSVDYYNAKIAELGYAWNQTNNQEQKDRLHEQANGFGKDAADSLKNINKDEKLKVELEIELLFDKSTKSAEQYSKVMDNLTFKESSLAESDLVGSLEVKKEMLNETTKEIQLQTEELDKLNAVTDESKTSTDKFKSSKDALIKSLQSNILKIKDLNKAQSDIIIKSVEDTENKVQEMIKKGLDLKKEALDKEKSDFKDFIDAKQKLLDDANSTEDYNADLKEALSERSKIQKQINALSYDQSYSSFQQRKDLEEKYSEATTKVNDLQKTRNRSLEKDALADSLKQKEDNIDTVKTALDKEWSNDKIRLEAHESTVNKSFDNIRSQFPELFADLGMASDTFFTSFEKYVLKFGEGIGDMKKYITDELLPQLQIATKYAGNIDTIKSTKTTQTANIPSNTTSALSTANQQSMEQYKKPTTPIAAPTKTMSAIEKAKEDIGKLQTEWNKLNSLVSSGMDQPSDNQKMIDIAKKANDIRIANKMENDKTDYRGYKGSYATGVQQGTIPETGNYRLHKGELILNAQNMANLIRNMSLNNFMPNIRPQTPQLSGGLSGGINLAINIAGNADNSTIGKIKDAGNNLLNDIKSTLAKNGIYRN